MRKYLLLYVLLLATGFLTAQTSCLSGQVIDVDDKEPLPFATVQAFQKGKLIAGTVTDLGGKFELCPLPKSGVVDVQVDYTGYPSAQIRSVPVDTSLVEIGMDSKGGVNLNEVVIKAYKVPLTQRDQTTSGQTVTAAQIRSLPRRRVGARRGKVAGLSKEGGPIMIRGSRTNNTDYFVDGVRVSGGGQSGENRERYNKITENPFLRTKDEAISTLSTDVDRAAYANVRRFLNNGQLPPADAVRTEEMINYFPYDDASPDAENKIALTAETMICPWAPKNRLLRVSTKAMPLSRDKAPASNFVFLIDVSGSMNSADKLGLVKESFKLLLAELGSEDRVSIVVYAGASGLVLPPTPGSERETILSALDRLKSGGGTAGAAGIELAYKTAEANFIPDGNNRVVLATDGDFNVGTSSQEALVKLIEGKRKSGIFLSVLGFGTGNYNEGTMQELADRGNGNHAYIDCAAEARKVLVEEFGGTLFTVATDVKLQLKFKPEAVKAYRLIGYENRLLATEDFDDDKKDAAEMGAGHSVTVLYEIVPAKTIEDHHHLGELHLRYKEKVGKRSRKRSAMITTRVRSWEEATENLRWGAAVAEFAMLLRGSEHLGKADWSHCESLATAALGKDEKGYRAEMLGLIRKAEELTNARR